MGEQWIDMGTDECNYDYDSSSYSYGYRLMRQWLEVTDGVTADWISFVNNLLLLRIALLLY